MRLHPRTPTRRDEEGAALIVAITLTIFALGVVISGSTLLRSNRQRTDTEFLVHGQAASFARAGLNDALNWLRRQPNQPVTVFAPQLDASATPPVLDTIDPDIGLVREFRVSGNIWGRYEVWKPWDADPDPERLAWRQQAQVRDVSLERDMPGAGAVWSLSCVAYVYRRNDPNAAFDQDPNEVLAREYFTTEATRLSITLPGQAALNVRDTAKVNMKGGSKVKGGASAAGIYHSQGTSLGSAQGELTGTPSQAPAAPRYKDHPLYVFGATEKRLKTMADDYLTDVTAVPSTIPNESFLFLEAPVFTFDVDQPLRGGGVLYLKGDLVILAGTSSFFTGLVYVDGNLTMYGPAEIQGSVIVTGDVWLEATGDFSTIQFGEETIASLQTKLNTYRYSRPIVRGGQRD